LNYVEEFRTIGYLCNSWLLVTVTAAAAAAGVCVLLQWSVSIVGVAVSVIVGYQFTRLKSTMFRQLQRRRQVKWSLRRRLDHNGVHALCAEVHHEHLSLNVFIRQIRQRDRQRTDYIHKEKKNTQK